MNVFPTKWLVFGSLLVYMICLPVFFQVPLGIALFGWKRVLLPDVLFALVVVAFIAWAAATPRFRPKSEVVVDCVLLLLAVGLPLLFSADPRRGVPDLYRFGYSAALYFVVAHVPFDGTRLRVFSWVWVGTAALLCALSFAAFARYVAEGTPSAFLDTFVGPAYKGNLSIRLRGTLGSPNTFAPYLNASLVFALVLLIADGLRWPARLLRLLLSALIVGAAAMTSSRSIAGIIVTLGLVGLAVLPRRGLGEAARCCVVAIMLVSILAVVVVSIWWVYPVRVVERTPSGELVVSVNATHSPYYLVYRGAIRMFLEHPLAGVGPGRFEANISRYFSWEEFGPAYGWADRSLDNALDRYVHGQDPHSTWLGWLARGGVLGMVFLLAFMIRVVRRLARADASRARVAHAFRSGIFGFIIIGCFVEIIHLRFFWLMLGVGTALATRPAGPEPAPTFPEFARP